MTIILHRGNHAPEELDDYCRNPCYPCMTR